MKKIIPAVSIAIANCLLFTALSFSQTIRPKVMPSAGGYYNVGGRSLSWTMGEPIYKTLQNGNAVLTQGFQQPYILLKILNLKAFIEGYYLGGGQMRALLFDISMSTDPTACDSIKVELHDAIFPNTIIATANGLLHTDGSAEILFPSCLINNYYYIVIHHRNAMETWSKVAILFNSSTMNFDFTSP